MDMKPYRIVENQRLLKLSLYICYLNMLWAQWNRCLTELFWCNTVLTVNGQNVVHLLFESIVGMTITIFLDAWACDGKIRRQWRATSPFLFPFLWVTGKVVKHRAFIYTSPCIRLTTWGLFISAVESLSKTSTSTETGDVFCQTGSECE